MHESVWVDDWKNLVLVLLFHGMAFDECSALHLESQCGGQLLDPGRLGCSVAFTILIVLVVVDLASEYVLPGLVEVALILDVQNDVVELVCLVLALGRATLVHELNQVFDMVLKHLSEGALLF